MRFNQLISLSLTVVLLSACKSAQEHKQDVSSGPSTFSLGNVQTSIQKGMPQMKVVAALGSPNIVTNDDDGYETWIYDKISSEVAQSSSSGGGSIILFGGQRSAGAYESSQKTLTVMIKFDSEKRVYSLNYHQSKF